MPYPCPACGFEVFPEPPGSYDNCPICGWEDDDVQLRFPTMAGGANKQSLLEFQTRLIRLLPLDVATHGAYCRCSDWRPLTQQDCTDTKGMPTNGIEYFEAAGTEDPQYYWRKSQA
jgi:hypothetical protein